MLINQSLMNAMGNDAWTTGKDTEQEVPEHPIWANDDGRASHLRG